MAKQPKYPNRVYKGKSSAEKASKRSGGKGTKKVDISTRSGGVKGFGIKW